MEIIVMVKSVYGVEKVYPVCDKARIFAGMLGQSTLTSDDIKSIKMLGYRILVESSIKEL